VEEADIGRCVWIEDESGASGAGAISFNSSAIYPDRIFKSGRSCRFLPGRAKLVTKPLPTGSPQKANTTGMVRFLLNIRVTWLVLGTITSGVCRLALWQGASLIWIAASPTIIWTLRPGQPTSRRPAAAL
jgi:hypothetical protein